MSSTVQIRGEHTPPAHTPTPKQKKTCNSLHLSINHFVLSLSNLSCSPAPSSLSPSTFLHFIDRIPKAESRFGKSNPPSPPPPPTLLIKISLTPYNMFFFLLLFSPSPLPTPGPQHKLKSSVADKKSMASGRGGSGIGFQVGPEVPEHRPVSPATLSTAVSLPCRRCRVFGCRIKMSSANRFHCD